VNACTALSGTLNFGNFNPVTVTNQLDATGTILVTCTQDASVVLSLSKGNGATFAARVLTSGSDTIPYNIYTASDHATIFGDGTSSTGTITIDGAGSTPVSTDIFGRIPAAPSAVAGNYTDSITITASY
jgi:spore coat protein U-like protein